ncbi:MAG: FCD domain-containing protein [Deltaproteobacteria bacterium]|nr:FCD domain-containing protein [Deltaproteobacteria bacterium]
MRSVLESYAARLATIRHLESELTPLEEKLLAYETSFGRGELEALPKINTEFHDLLYGLSRSPRLIKMINDLRDQIYRFRLMTLKIDGMARLSNENHRRMLKAIKVRDADGVEKLVREHILRGQDVVLNQFDIQNN